MIKEAILELNAGLMDLKTRIEALERLVPPKGSDSGDLLPDTRSGAGDKSTKSDGSEKPLPDQGWGALSVDADTTEWNVWLKSDEGNNARGEVGDEVFNLGWNAIAAAFVAGRRSMESAPRTQSVADGDEVKAAFVMALGCLEVMAAAADRASKLQEDNGIPDGAKASANKAAECRKAIPVLKSFLPELSRKERSVSGNAPILPPGGAVVSKANEEGAKA